MSDTHRIDGTAPGDEHRGLGEMFRSLSADAATLVRQEAALARAELRESVRSLAGDLGRVGIGAAVAGVGVLTLVAFLVALLGDLLGSYWLGALIVALVLLAIGGGLAFVGVRRMRERRLKPEETLDSLRVTGSWARSEAEHLRGALAPGGPDGSPPGAGTSARAAADPRAAGEKRHPTATRGSSRIPEGSGRGRAGDAREDQSFGKRLLHEFQDDDIPGQAAKVAYFAFLSLPPALLVIFGLTGFFGGEAAAAWITENLRRALPEGASDLIEGFVDQVVNESAPGPFSIGLLLALWAASNVFMALGDALNKAYDVEDDRSWVKRRGIALGVMLAFAVLFLGGSTVLLVGPEITSALQLGGAMDLFWTIARWPIAFGLIVGGFWICYYALPDRDQSRDKSIILRGAAIAAVLWLLATAAFRLYISNFGSYTETYGFLGMVIILLLWLYITGLVALLGGEINSEI